MISFAFSWEEKVERTVIINADTQEEAMELWRSGNWDYTPYVDNEEIIDGSVEVEVAE